MACYTFFVCFLYEYRLKGPLNEMLALPETLRKNILFSFVCATCNFDPKMQEDFFVCLYCVV